MMEEKDVVKETEEIKETVNNALNENIVEEFLANKYFTYVYKDVTYKLGKPNFKQKQELYSAIAKKKMEFLNSDVYLPASVLKEKWKTKGIDLDLMEKEIRDLIEEKSKIQNRLGMILKDVQPTDDLKSFEDKINQIEFDISCKRNTMMSYLDTAIETQIEVFAHTYLVFISALKKEGEEFVKAWETYEDFENNDEDLINVLSLYSSVLSRDDLNI